MSLSEARIKKREKIVEAAHALVGYGVPLSFDPVHSPICAIDVVMVAGAPWLKDALEKDFYKDESGYKKIGGGANTPKMPYFCRSANNLIHFLKRQGFYIPSGGDPKPEAGMACFLDFEDRGRFNFAPDRSGIIVSIKNGEINSIVLAVNTSAGNENAFLVKNISVSTKDYFGSAIIGYSDLP